MDLLTTKICMQSDIGVNNNLFGGRLLAWIDETAAAYATDFCQTPNMVTLKISEVTFKQPIKKSNLIKIYAKPTKIGNTSITIYIEVRKISVERQEEVIVTTAELIFVRIDNEGKPIKINDNIREKFKNYNTQLIKS